MRRRVIALARAGGDRRGRSGGAGRRPEPRPARPAARRQGPAALGRRHRARLRRVEGTSSTREGVPFDARRRLHRRRPRPATLTDARLADYGGQPRPATTRSSSPPATSATASTTPTARRQLPLRAHRRRVGDAGQVRADVRDPPAQRLHRAQPGARPQRRRRRDPGRRRRHAHRRRQGGVPLPQGTGPDRQRRPDPAASETFGYAGDAREPAETGRRWSPDRTAPPTSGIYTHPDDGREEMVMTVASNENQSHAQLLRHGMLNWVTRGVFLGYQRNYLELQVDDLFLGDDAWDPATHTTNYDPAAASRMTPADVDQARGLVGKAQRPAPRLRLQRRRQRALQGPDGRVERSAGRRRSPAGNKRRVRLHQPHLRPPEPGLLDGRRSSPRRSTTTSRGPTAHGMPIDRVRGRHRRALRAWPTRGRATRARSTRRRSTTSSRATPAGGGVAGRHLRLRADGAARAAGETTASIAPASPSPRPAAASTVDLQRRLPRGRLHAVPQRGAAPARGRVVGTLTRPEQRRRPTTAPTRSTLTITDDQAAGHRRRAARRQRRRARALRAEPELPGGAARRGHRASSPPTRPRPTRRPGRTSPAPQWPLGATFTEGTPSSSFRPSRATRATSTTTSRARASSSTSTTGSTSRRPTAAAACRSPSVTTCRTTAGDLDRLRGEREHHHVPPRHGQRPAAALHAPEQPGRLQPGAARDRPQPGRRSCIRSSTACSARYDATFDRAERAAGAADQRADRGDARPAGRVGGAPRRRQRHGVAAGRQAARQEHERGRGRRAADRHHASASSTPGSVRLDSRSPPAPSRCSAPNDPANTTAPSGHRHATRRRDADRAATARGPGTPTIGYGYQWQRCDARARLHEHPRRDRRDLRVATADDAARRCASSSPRATGSRRSARRRRRRPTSWPRPPCRPTTATATAVAAARCGRRPAGRGRSGKGKKVGELRADAHQGEDEPASASRSRTSASRPRHAPGRLAHHAGSSPSAATVRLVVQRQAAPSTTAAGSRVGTIRRSARPRARAWCASPAASATKPLAPRAYRLP